MLVVVLAAVLLSGRSGRRIDARVASAVAELDDRMEAMVRESSRALERAEEESRRARTLGDLAASLDLDDVLERALEAARAVPGADAALASLPAFADGKPMIVTLGLSPEEAGRQDVIAGPPDGQAMRAISMQFRYTPENGARNGPLIGAGLAVPLRVDGQEIGHLAVFTHGQGASFDHVAVRELEEIAQRAAPAIQNAQRYREALRLADLDALTGLHNRRFFYETLAREVARARRYERSLSLIVLDLDDFKSVNDRIGHLAGDAVLAEAAERIRPVVRSADVACRIGGDEFAVILPEATIVEADRLYRRIQYAVSSRPIGQAGRLQISAGVCELGPGEEARSFFERADEALYRAKAVPRRTG